MIITKETLLRAGRTFLQSALAYITVNAVYINLTGNKASDKSAIIGLLVSVIANLIIQKRNKTKNQPFPLVRHKQSKTVILHLCQNLRLIQINP